MASPQKENGYTPIANELLEALTKAMPGFTEGQILWCVIRKTYGWQKKEDKLSISQLSGMTGKSRRMIIYALKSLERKKMIIIKRENHEVNELSLQKDYSRWIVKDIALVQGSVKGSAISCQKVVQDPVKSIPKVAPTKETITKETKETKERTIPLRVPVKKQATPGHEIAKYFYTKYKDVFGKEYIASFGKDGKIFKDIAKIVSPQEAFGLIDAFFNSQDAFVVGSGYTVGCFKSQINKLRNPQNQEYETKKRLGMI